MVNLGLGPASILGIIIAVAGAGLYFMRSVRPELSRDHDIFFAAIGLLCGFILIFQGWRLDPILAFGQILLSASAIFFAVESIRLRGVATTQAKRRTPIVEDDRPVSDVYRYEYEAELDQLDPVDDLPPRRRIRGTEDRTRRTDGYEEDIRPRPSSRPSSRSAESQSQGNPRRQQRRSSPPQGRSSVNERPDDWDDRSRGQTVDEDPDSWDTSRGKRSEQPDDWDANTRETKPSRRNTSSSTRPVSRDPEKTSKPRRNRPPEESASRRSSSDGEAGEATPADYVDYKPVDRPDEGN